MKRLILLCLLISGTIQLHAQNDVTTFILVRHAEKSTDDPRDPSLSEEGIKRAEALKTMLSQADIAALYSSPYKRTKGTVQPIAEAKAEVEKCAWVCRYYADHSEEFLRSKVIETDASKSYVSYEPLGVIYAIMPWNFPFWQVFRFAAPTLMAGNTALLKHAPNVTRCALDIEEIFAEAGAPVNAFRTLILDNDHASKVIEHPLVRAVSLTGSERAGVAVASTAGSVLKSSLLELGGSNAVIVLDDADLDAAVDTGFKARFLNSGQSCIAGKRFLVMDSIYDAYIEKFKAKVEQLKCADPLSGEASIGPLARVDLAEGIERQVNQSIKNGAELVCGGKRDGAKYEATVLKNVKPGMAAFDEETFGPLAAT